MPDYTCNPNNNSPRFTVGDIITIGISYGCNMAGLQCYVMPRQITGTIQSIHVTKSKRGTVFILSDTKFNGNLNDDLETGTGGSLKRSPTNPLTYIVTVVRYYPYIYN